MCKCAEGRFERTKENFAGRYLHPFAQTFVSAKVGTICQAPPVHDCQYIVTRDRLVAQAWHEAAVETATIKDAKVRSAKWQERAQERTRQLVAEHYATKKP